MATRTMLAPPRESGCTCYDDYYPPPSRYYETEVYYDEPEQYVLKAVVPAGPRRRYHTGAGPNCSEIGVNCLGSIVYGTANCLAATVEVCAAFVGGIFKTCTGMP